MKKICSVCFLLLAVVPLSAQYTITKVVGNVYNDASNEKINIGYKLSDNDRLRWDNPAGQNDMLRAIVAGKGVFIITPSLRLQNNQNGIVEFVKISLKIKAKGGYLSGRAEGEELVPANFETESKVTSKNLFAQQNKYLFDRTVYNVDDGGRFFLQIERPGATPVIKALKTSGDTLLVNASDFEVQDSMYTDNKTTYKLGFFSKENKTSQQLIDIIPVIDTANEMESIIALMIRESKESDMETLRQACYAEVYEALGKPSDIQFNQTFNRLVALRPK